MSLESTPFAALAGWGQQNENIFLAPIFFPIVRRPKLSLEVIKTVKVTALSLLGPIREKPRMLTSYVE